MAYVPTENILGLQRIADTETTARHTLGTRIRAVDSTYGEGTFIYLLGVDNTEVGLMVKWNATTYQTVILTNTVVQAVPIAVAMSANTGSKYGWYQVEGNAVIKKTAVKVLAQVTLFISATAGRVKALASNGLQIVGARSANLATVTSTTSTVVVTINNPHCQSQVT